MSNNVEKLEDRVLDGLDISEGLRSFEGNEKAYLRILGIYARETRLSLEKIDKVSEDNLSAYMVKMHGLKGASLSIFANEVAKDAKALENAALLGDVEYISKHNKTFIDNTRSFVLSLEVMIADINSANPKKSRAEPDPVTLRKLLKACIDYDVDEADEIMEELEEYDYESGNEFVAGLREDVDLLQFNEIIEKLSAS